VTDLLLYCDAGKAFAGGINPAPKGVDIMVSSAGASFTPSPTITNISTEWPACVVAGVRPSAWCAGWTLPAI
jgi:hypothetical protein